MLDVLNGMYNTHFDQIHIVDCRFPYEFSGGHISDALNIDCSEVLEKAFFSSPKASQRTLIIFHCEFSLQRAPAMYTFTQINTYIQGRSSKKAGS
jgi:M-phase inducer tyrosine phosphatase